MWLASPQIGRWKQLGREKTSLVPSAEDVTFRDMLALSQEILKCVSVRIFTFGFAPQQIWRSSQQSPVSKVAKQTELQLSRAGTCQSWWVEPGTMGLDLQMRGCFSVERH
jgi:hypothetical protein